ncbi:conserved Plasmodium protein, unknown function [Plasmodium reichenowi]|uniref:Uncharacterized protein n=1 Tax=Plasmodium reichenowi TaxID=5854 RepID=A0A060RZQ0_PLARE|nr:conserved Plasmodium protein, unknown function [Plasmodium reichenowi]
MMYFKKDKKLFDEKLNEELTQLKDYRIIHDVLVRLKDEKRKKQKKKRGSLFNLIELKYINKILYELYITQNKKCIRNFVNIYDHISLHCNIQKIIQIEKGKKYVALARLGQNVHMNGSLHFLKDKNNNFFIFHKINYYMNKQLFEIKNDLSHVSTSSCIIIFYNESSYSRRKKYINCNYEKDECSNISYKRYYKKCMDEKNNILTYMKENQLNDINKNNKEKKNIYICSKNKENNNYTYNNFIHPDNHTFNSVPFLYNSFIKNNDKQVKKNEDTKKFVDHYMLFINYKNKSISHISFIIKFKHVLYKLLHNEENRHIFIINENNNNVCMNHTNDNTNGFEKCPIGNNNMKNSLVYDMNLRDVVNFIRDRKKYNSYNIFPVDYLKYIFHNKKKSKCLKKGGLKKSLESIASSLLLPKGVCQNINININKNVNINKSKIKKGGNNINCNENMNNRNNTFCNYEIYIYQSDILKREKNIFVTFNNMNQCFYIFIYPFIIYFNKYKYVLSNMIPNLKEKKKKKIKNNNNNNNKNNNYFDLILQFIVELFIIFRIMYKKKKLINKLKKYLSNRTLKGFINYNNLNKMKKNNNKKNIDTCNYIYIYTFYSIMDNFCLKEKNYNIHNTLFHKIKKVLMKYTNIIHSNNIYIKFVQNKLIRICKNVTDLLSWNNMLENMILLENQYIYVYFFLLKKNTNEQFNILNKDNIILYNNKYDYYNKRKNKNEKKKKKKKKHNFHLINIFKIITTCKRKILNVTKNICSCIYFFFSKYNTFTHLERISILNNFQYILKKFPYLLLLLHFKIIRKIDNIFYTRFLQNYNNIFFIKLFKEKYQNQLQIIKKKKKKLLKNICYSNDVEKKRFLFLFKMNKWLLYFFLYLMNIYFSKNNFYTNIRKKTTKKTKKKKKDIHIDIQDIIKNIYITNNKKKQLSNNLIYMHKCTFYNFKKFIQNIKKEKKSIYKNFSTNINKNYNNIKTQQKLNFICVHDNKDIIKNNHNHNNNHDLSQTKQNYKHISSSIQPIISSKYISKIISLDHFLNLKCPNIMYHRQNKKSININTNQNRTDQEKKFISTDFLKKFFTLKNMKYIVSSKYINNLIHKNKEKEQFTKKTKILYFLNVHNIIQKSKLIKIIQLFDDNMKNMLLHLLHIKNNHINKNDTSCNNDKIFSLNKNDVDQILRYKYNPIKVNKKLCIFNNIENIILTHKLKYRKKKKYSYVQPNIIYNIFHYNEKQSFYKIIKNKQIESYKITLNYFIYFVNAHISYSVNIFNHKYEKVSDSNGIHILNIYKNDIIKNMFIERTMNFLEIILFLYLRKHVPFVQKYYMTQEKQEKEQEKELEKEQEKEQKKEQYNNTNKYTLNIYQIFCYDIVQNLFQIKHIFDVEKEGKFNLNIFIYHEENLLFFYSSKKNKKQNDTTNKSFYNPFFVKFLENDEYYDVSLDNSTIRKEKN